LPHVLSTLHPFPTRRSSDLQAEADITSNHLEAAAELLTLRRDRIQIIDAENNRLKEDEQEKQESGEEQKKPKPKGRKAKEPKKQDRKSTRLNSSHVSISYAV